MPEGTNTAEVSPERRSDPAASKPRRKLPGLTGAVAAGLTVLAVLVIVAQAFSWVHGYPGPGALMTAGHVVAAAAALAAQRLVDAEAGGRATWCAALIGALALAVLAVFWWL